MAGKKLAIKPKDTKDIEEDNNDECPHCNIELVHAEGCKTCPICEYSLCTG